MGKGKKPKGEEEVLGQIFDFIFKEAKKRPDKRKPIKSTGISTSKEVVDGLAAALEQPGMYVTDQILSNMNDALTIEFARINADEGGANKAKLTTTSLIGFLDDPNKFFDKPKNASKMGIREATRAAFLGRVHQGLVANAWAHKYNLDLDAKKAIRMHYQADSSGSEAEAGRAFASASAFAISGGDDNSRKNYVASRSAALVGREMFGRSGWESMNDERKAALQKAIIRGNDAVKDYLSTTYSGPSARLAGIALSNYDLLRKDIGLVDPAKKLNKPIDVFDQKIYNTLETRNIEGRIEDMKMYLARNPRMSINDKAKVEAGIDKLGQALVIVSGNHVDLGNINAAKIALQSKITGYKSSLAAAQKAGDKNQIKYYKEQIRNLQEGDRELNNMRFWGTIGKYEGLAGSLKDVLGEGLAPNAISSVLDGSFYDRNRNSFALPVTDKNKGKFGSYSWYLKDENGVKQLAKHDEEITILTADITDLSKLKGAARTTASMRNNFNVMMTNIYYLTPRAILRTLFVNGEGFVYLSYKTSQNALKKLGKAGLDFDRLMKDSAYRKSLKALGVDANSLYLTRGLAQIFSFGQRKRDMIKTWMDDHLFKQLRQKIYNSLIKKITDTEALALLEKWLVKGGFETIAKALVIGILDALGIAATGGLGSFLVPILSALVVDVLYGAVKIIAQVILLVGLGIIGFIILGFSNDKKNFDSQTYAYTNVVPGDVVSNPNFSGTSPIIGEDDPTNNLGNFVGGSLPAGEKCLLGSSGSFHCSQGPFSEKATPTSLPPSHANVAAIDVTGVQYFYAPAFCGNNNCKVTYVGEAKCYAGSAGGMMKFTATYGGNTYEFSLIHVQPGVGSGASLSSGQRVARVMTREETTKACSSGMHIHIQTKMNGKAVDPREVLNSNPSSGGFSCSINECPHKV